MRIQPTRASILKTGKDCKDHEYCAASELSCLSPNRSVTTVSMHRSLFVSSDKDFKLRIYKTAGNKLVRERVIQGTPGRWTVTDHNLSLDSHWLIYSSITPYVHLTRTDPHAPSTHHQLDFSTGNGNEGVRTDKWRNDVNQGCTMVVDAAFVLTQ